ncbi:MAG: fatty acid desaturase [Mycobacterium sp.]|uniref:fatty acid desaturase n=1 Tax=Mycobacterium sp. TaxID=1785 RepID=UPI00260E2BAF|nr:fatty acid desaturase [Mycobacterium sp.]MDI3313810.1 fatty acid desaturase [Mycobacterium sp.]
MDALRYYLVSLVSGVALAGLWLGGGWVWAGIATFPILMFLDIVLPADHKVRNIRVPWLAEVPLYLHLPLLAALWALFALRLGAWTGHTTVALPGGTVGAAGVVGMVLSVGWIGAVPNLPIAHELMHRRALFPRAVAKVYSTVYLDPNRDVGHKLTHHLDLCTEKDSDTPRRGQSIYAFMWQASYGAWKDGVVTSVTSLRKRDLSVFHPKNAVYLELGLLALLFAAVYAVAGPAGLVPAAAAMVFSKLLVEGFNYLQHYGLVRVPGSPIQLQHAWNHLGAIIRPLGVEITTHIEHHLDSRYKYHELKPRPEAPQMPSAFLCFVCALIPPLWERLIAQPRLRHWDEHFASPAEKELAMAANRKAGWPQWQATSKASQRA